MHALLSYSCQIFNRVFLRVKVNVCCLILSNVRYLVHYRCDSDVKYISTLYQSINFEDLFVFNLLVLLSVYFRTEVKYFTTVYDQLELMVNLIDISFVFFFLTELFTNCLQCLRADSKDYFFTTLSQGPPPPPGP